LQPIARFARWEGGAKADARQELYDTIGHHAFEELDADIIRTIVPHGMPQPA
jgi:methylisocitrate lyase